MLIVPAILAVALAVPTGCDVTDATLDWGFKESFRAYIDGSIANGEWTTSDGATYEVPEFTWSNGTGEYFPATGDGYIDFTGTVRFTGHDGLLDTTMANPRVVLDGDSGMLLLDVAGATMEGDVLDQEAVKFIALPSVEVVGGDAVRTVDAATELTGDGAIAFPNYEAGTAFDPVSVTMTVGKQCPVAAPDNGTLEPPQSGPVWPWLIGGIAIILLPLLLIGGLVAVFVVTRRRRRA